MNNSKILASDDEDDTLENAKPMLCPNCKQMISAVEMATHTVACYRNSTKCKICGEIIQKDRKKDHINKFRDYTVSLPTQSQALLTLYIWLIKLIIVFL